MINTDNGSVFDPNDASVVNGAATWAVNVTIDTDAKTIDSGGGPIAVPSDDAVSEGGDVTLTMFTFSSLTVNAVTVTVTGSRGLVLATTGALTMNGIIKAAGVNGSDPPGNNLLATGGAGGPGGGAGGDTGASTAAGSGTDGTAPTNNGGLPATVAGQAAGAGEEGGGGGAHAGGGGFGSRSSSAGGQTVNGGFAYGDGALNELYGGSGGGGGYRTNGGGSVELGGAGGGGGAIELLARGTLTVNGTIDVSGGDGGLLDSPSYSGNDYGGGGGGGGGVILAGINMVIGATAVVDASGGDGSQKPVAGGNSGGHRPAGGGGGGRIAIYSDALADAGGTYNTAGGAESNWEPAGSQTDGGVGSLAIVNTIDLDAPPALTATSGSVMDPNDGISNGAATWSAAVAIDTDAKSVTVGGVPLILPFQDVTSEGGDVTLTAITFSDLTIDPGVTVTVTGSQGLILAATNNLTVNGDIVTTGSIGSTATNAIASGGAGGGGGGPGGSSGGSAFGANGQAGSAPANNGALPATVRGPAGTVGQEQGGAGGGFGGAGGVGSTANTTPTSSSVSYGTAALTELYGGSGGGGGHRTFNGTSWETGGGGGGGGALELVARGTLTLNGSIDASGGPGGQVNPDGGSGNDYGGGGGGGGGVILAGVNVVLGAASSVSATGGDGSQDPVAPNTAGSDQRPAGGGGGGRVAVLAQNYTNNGVTIDVSGGARTDWQTTSAQTDGGVGTFTEIRTVGLGVAPAINAVAGSIMDPNLAFSNGDATWSAAVTINTTTQVVTVGGVPAFLAFQPINSVGGDAKLIALNFDNLTIDPAVVVTVTGEFGLILGATGNLTMNGSINASGADGANSAGNNVLAVGGDGGPGGGLGGSTGGVTPGPGTDGTAAANNGGLAANTAGERGDNNQGGGGGAFGGAGGTGSNEGGTPSDGGLVYGVDALDELYGGSGGGGGHRDFGGNSAELAGAGGGGGALELVARGTLTLNGPIDVSGGDGGSLDASGGGFSGNDYGGGGGGGGGVVIAGANVVITTAATIDASGGDASDNSAGAPGGTNRPAGGGGAGRIAIFADSLSNGLSSVDLSGGARSDWHTGTAGHSDGADGSIYVNATVNLVPTSVTATHGSILDPNDAVNSGTQTWSANVVIDTTLGTVLVGGAPVMANFERITSVGGDATMSALTFTDLTIDPGVTVSVTGDTPLILAATNNLNMNGIIDASGADGLATPANNTIGVGGTAGAGGGDGGDSGGRVLPALGNAGGIPANNGGLTAAVAGQVDFSVDKGGGGGSFGGAGGAGSNSGTLLTSGGIAYGDDALSELYGGSGGAGAHRAFNGTSMESAGGGAGGGGIQLVASGTLSIDGTIDVSGGDAASLNAGGGSSGADYGSGGGGGGGVLLAGTNVSISTASTITADGGDATKDSTAPNADDGGQRPGGGGGGGRIAIYADSLANGGTFTVGGGVESDFQFAALNTAGDDGSIRQFSTSTFVPVATVTAADGSIFDPNNGLSNGAATWAANVNINTDSGNVVVGGVPQAVDWTDATSASGNVTLKMLTFSDLTIDPGVTVTVEGSRGLVLAATNTLTVDGTINADGNIGGASAGNNIFAPGGIGGPGGGDGGITDNAVDAGTHKTTAGSPAPGLGLTAANAGQIETSTNSGGGGGGYGEAGGNGSDAVATTSAVGGTAYGNDAIDDLYGGSGGGGGNRTSAGNDFSGGGGGGGGGALELIARGTLAVNGTVTANGGDGGLVDPVGGPSATYYGGGGGGGGGIILAGITVNIAATAVIEANGGAGSPDVSPSSPNDGGLRPAGGGGAGRIAVYADSLANTGTFSVDGGLQSNWQGNAPASDGGDGSLASIPTASLVPMPVTESSGIASIILPDPALSNGAQTWSAPVVIDTDLKSITVGGVPIPVTASDASSVTGKVTLTMFTFSDLTVDPGVTVTVQGTRGLSLGATGTITMNGIIDVSGSDGGNGSSTTGVGAGGSGGPGGGDGGQGAPGPNGGGQAGDPATGIGVPVAAGGQIGNDTGGAGGGYANSGGRGVSPSGSGFSTGGVSYGDDALTELYGGSGGSGSSRVDSSGYEMTGGGGGGGAVELVAGIAIVIDGSVDATGGDGGPVDASGGGGSNNDYGAGGGSGGGILIAAPIVTINAAGIVTADGGRGSQSAAGNSGFDRPGGGGSGGRIAIYADDLTNNGTVTHIAGVASNFDSFNGTSRGPADAGGVGTLATPPGGFALAVPTLSQWGIIILSLLIACVGMIRISQMYPRSGHAPAITTAWPLDLVGFKRGLRISLGIAAVGWTLSLAFTGTIAFSDLLGGSLAVPVFAYFLHIFPLLAKRD